MNKNWSEPELKAAVEAYIDMRNQEIDGKRFVKKRYYSNLSRRFGRTEKSFEYRMQNISYVYSLMGRTWVSGLKPAKNVGANTAALIERLIFEVEGEKSRGIVKFETQVIAYKEKNELSEPLGIKEPEKTCFSVTGYNRDPKVKAWVLKEASGNCE